jgi:hypothetical protein
VEKKRRVIEIEVFKGSTTRFLAEQMDRTGVLYAIDPFFAGRFGICFSEIIARVEMWRSRGARIPVIKALSHDAACKGILISYLWTAITRWSV